MWKSSSVICKDLISQKSLEMEENSNSQASNEGNDLPNWVGMNVASAFFASLEHFSCVHVNTIDTDDEDDEEADNTLLLTILPSPSASSSSFVTAESPRSVSE